MVHLRIRSTLVLFMLVGLSACNGADAPSTESSTAPNRPLQPLIYTERPELSVEAAAVRERRLMRQLLEGSSETGNWGDLEAPKASEHPPLTNADELGKAMFAALIERDEGLWDALFVAPEDYAGMVHLELDKAREFIDDVQAQSRPAWKSFEPGRPSEAREDGLAGLLEFDSLELGEARTVAGAIAKGDEPVAQYWGNQLKLRLAGTDLTFELGVPKILKIDRPRRRPGQAMLGVASAVRMSSQLEVYLRAGLHLKPELLETREYPYPLAVGNFWRYRRTPVDGTDDARALADDPPAAEGLTTKLGATETLLEVTSVDRHGSWRLVTLRRTYDDEGLTSHEQYWLVLPRRIYRCSSACRTRADDLEWLLSYVDQEAPIFRFPMGLEDTWGKGGHTGPDQVTFEIGSDWHDVEVPDGNYANTVAIDGVGPLTLMDSYYRGRDQTRYFAHGRGVVKRVLEASEDGSRGPVVESLLESRIMPR